MGNPLEHSFAVSIYCCLCLPAFSITMSFGAYSGIYAAKQSLKNKSLRCHDREQIKESKPVQWSSFGVASIFGQFQSSPKANSARTPKFTKFAMSSFSNFQ